MSVFVILPVVAAMIIAVFGLSLQSYVIDTASSSSEASFAQSCFASFIVLSGALLQLTASLIPALGYLSHAAAAYVSQKTFKIVGRFVGKVFHAVVSALFCIARRLNAFIASYDRTFLVCLDSAPPQPRGRRNGRLEYTTGLYEEHRIFSLSDLLRRCKDFLSTFFFCDKIKALEFCLKVYKEMEDHALQKMAEAIIGPEIIRVGLEYTDKQGLLEFLNFTRLCSNSCFKRFDDERKLIIDDRSFFLTLWGVILGVMTILVASTMGLWCLPYLWMFAVGFVGYLSLHEVMNSVSFTEDLAKTRDGFFNETLGSMHIDEVTMGPQNAYTVQFRSAVSFLREADEPVLCALKWFQRTIERKRRKQTLVCYGLMLASVILPFCHIGISYGLPYSYGAVKDSLAPKTYATMKSAYSVVATQACHSYATVKKHVLSSETLETLSETAEYFHAQLAAQRDHLRQVFKVAADSERLVKAAKGGNTLVELSSGRHVAMIDLKALGVFVYPITAAANALGFAKVPASNVLNTGLPSVDPVPVHGEDFNLKHLLSIVRSVAMIDIKALGVFFAHPITATANALGFAKVPAASNVLNQGLPIVGQPVSMHGEDSNVKHLLSIVRSVGMIDIKALGVFFAHPITATANALGVTKVPAASNVLNQGLPIVGHPVSVHGEDSNVKHLLSVVRAKVDAVVRLPRVYIKRKCMQSEDAERLTSAAKSGHSIVELSGDRLVAVVDLNAFGDWKDSVIAVAGFLGFSSPPLEPVSLPGEVIVQPLQSMWHATSERLSYWLAGTTVRALP